MPVPVRLSNIAKMSHRILIHFIVPLPASPFSLVNPVINVCQMPVLLYLITLPIYPRSQIHRYQSVARSRTFHRMHPCRSTPICAFIPKCHSFPFFVCFISGSRLCGSRRLYDRRVYYRPAMHDFPLLFQLSRSACQRAQFVFFTQVTELQKRRAPLPIQPHKFPHRVTVIYASASSARLNHTSTHLLPPGRSGLGIKRLCGFYKSRSRNNALH
jgi:hypothetical protein